MVVFFITYNIIIPAKCVIGMAHGQNRKTMKQPDPIKACKDCPYHYILSGRGARCKAALSKRIPNNRTIPHWCPLPDAPVLPDEDQMTDLERSVWSTVHMWADGQSGEIPDMNRRHLMDLILEIVKKYSE